MSILKSATDDSGEGDIEDREENGWFNFYKYSQTYHSGNLSMKATCLSIVVMQFVSLNREKCAVESV